MSRQGFYIALCIFVTACAAAPQGARFIPPETQVGKECIAACTAAREECIIREEEEYRECLSLRKFDLRVYENCAHARDPFEQGTCRQPSLCPAPDVIPCEREFRGCYSACGGQVVVEPGP
jgi:hypothetical protein